MIDINMINISNTVGNRVQIDQLIRSQLVARCSEAQHCEKCIDQLHQIVSMTTDISDCQNEIVYRGCHQLLIVNKMTILVNERPQTWIHRRSSIEEASHFPTIARERSLASLHEECAKYADHYSKTLLVTLGRGMMVSAQLSSIMCLIAYDCRATASSISNISPSELFITIIFDFEDDEEDMAAKPNDFASAEEKKETIA